MLKPRMVNIALCSVRTDTPSWLATSALYNVLPGFDSRYSSKLRTSDKYWLRFAALLSSTRDTGFRA